MFPGPKRFLFYFIFVDAQKVQMRSYLSLPNFLNICFFFFVSLEIPLLYNILLALLTRLCYQHRKIRFNPAPIMSSRACSQCSQGLNVFYFILFLLTLKRFRCVRIFLYPTFCTFVSSSSFLWRYRFFRVIICITVHCRFFFKWRLMYVYVRVL